MFIQVHSLGASCCLRAGECHDLGHGLVVVVVVVEGQELGLAHVLNLYVPVYCVRRASMMNWL